MHVPAVGLKVVLHDDAVTRIGVPEVSVKISDRLHPPASARTSMLLPPIPPLPNGS
jgi:hypothetical protein